MKKAVIDNRSIISTVNSDISKLVSHWHFLGKRVLGSSGEKIGRVWNVLYSSYTITHIVAYKRFKKKIISVNLISSISKNTIMLKVTPVFTNMGKKVFDADGRYLGKVINIIKEDQKNKFNDLIVQKRIFTQKHIISADEIRINKKNIILSNKAK